MTRVGVYIAIMITVMLSFTTASNAKQPKAKFYDFSEQLIDGEIKKPTTLYTDARKQVKFERLLRLKKSFLPKLFDTAKDPVFRR